MISSEHVVRIGAGKLRGRLLSVIDANGLRPTPDRVRESVFNWIGGKCAGARVVGRWGLKPGLAEPQQLLL